MTLIYACRFTAPKRLLPSRHDSRIMLISIRAQERSMKAVMHVLIGLSVMITMLGRAPSVSAANTAYYVSMSGDGRLNQVIIDQPD